MDPTSRAVLQNFNFKDPNKEYLLCIKTEANGAQSLDRVKRDEATSVLNNILKFIGLGPLANRDTSITNVDRYIERQIKADMKEGTQATASKLSDVVATSKNALNHLFAVNEILTKFPDGAQKEIPLEDLILISKNENSKLIRKDTPIENLKEAVNSIRLLNTKEKELLDITTNPLHFKNKVAFTGPLIKEIDNIREKIENLLRGRKIG